MRRHAYEGPRLPAAQIATVFARWRGPDQEQTYICAVNGRSHRLTGPISPCPSVVYVPTGNYLLEVELRLGFRYGTVLIPLRAVAGQTYEVVAQFHDASHLRYGSREMPTGFALTYRDLAPSFFARGDRPNQPVDPDAPD